MEKILFCLLVATVAKAQDPVLPEGKGREAVENACTVCHSAERITKQSLTIDQWRSEVRTMVENGASLNPDEWEPVVAYLTKNFGPRINVNIGNAKEIAEGLNLTKSEAEAIVTYRTANGAFKDLKDLEKVPGLDTKKLATKEKSIAF
jgi:competence ComEA-like helix-hairpin-helix protein